MLINMSSSNRTNITPFLESTIHNNPGTVGGILSSSLTAWTALGPHLRVLDLSTGLRISSWHFGHTMRDYTTQVLSVAEVQNPETSHARVPLFVVGLSSGLVCVYEPVTSRVLRAIVVGAPVISLATVCGDGLELCGPGRLLEAFDGVVAVGLDGGDVLLLDLCRQSINEALNIYSRSLIRNEERPCEITTIYHGDLARLNQLKERATNAGRHLAYHINYHPAMDGNEQLSTPVPGEPHFPLQSTTGDVLLFAPRSHVAVTSLLYAAPLRSVLVGYSFGCWQLLSLLDDPSGGEVLYTSLLHRERMPVRWFALQEPSDDPRTCCYVWAVHDGGEGGAQSQDVLSCAVMYVLNYERKEWHEGYGWMYERLNSCTIRFQMDLTNDFPATNPSSPNATSRCLSLRSYSLGTSAAQPTHHKRNATDDPLELCALTYATTSDRTQVYMLLFDLNQWYLSQMPGEPQPRLCDTYITRVCLSEGAEDGARFLDVRLDKREVRGFRMRLRRLEEHFRADALSYNCTILSPTNSCKLYHLGTQSHLLHQLSSLGPLALLKPGHLYTQALTCGLAITNNVHTLPHAHQHPPTLQQQRETLLDIALEQHLQSVLESCATEWADGSGLAVGCALHGWLLEWAWARATQLKQEVDQTLCIQVFTGNSVLDNRARVQLDCYTGQLGRLMRLFEHVRTLGGVDGEGWMVDRRAQTLGAVCRWLSVVRWLLGNGLLPESAQLRGEEGGGRVDYSFNRIKSIVEKRRHAINKSKCNLSKNLPTPQLYIDNLIEQELGTYSVINSLWTNSTQQETQPISNNNKYPPNSIQAALRTYLMQAQIQYKTTTSIDQVTLIQHQHTLFSYLMLDIAQEFNEHQQQVEQSKDQLRQKLIAFPLTFNEGSKLSKLVQAMWLLDRGDFAQAMEELVDPNVTSHAPPWLHKCVVLQLLAQAQHRFALLYVQLRRPPKLGYVMRESLMCGAGDDWLMCTLFVRNGRFYDALKCSRETATSNVKFTEAITTNGPNDIRDIEDRQKGEEGEDQRYDNLLSHIWSECLQTGQLSNKFITSVHGLTLFEEESLFNFMDRVQYPNRYVMRTIYMLQRATSHQHLHLKLTVQPEEQHATSSTNESTFYDKMLNNLLSKNDLMIGEPGNIDSKIDGSVPMSVLVHYNNFMSSKAKNRIVNDTNNSAAQSPMLWTIRNTCTATIRAILRRQQQEQVEGQEQSRHVHGQKRKLHRAVHNKGSVKGNDSASTQTTSASKLLPQHKSLPFNMELDDSEQYNSPRKKGKPNAPTSYQQLQTPPVIDASYQMETPLVKRQRPLQGQRESNWQYAAAPSTHMNTDYIRESETPQSILKKRIESMAAIGTNSKECSVEVERTGRESTMPDVLVESHADENVLKERLSPKRRRSIGRSADGAASLQATVRFNISLSTTTSTSDNATTDNYTLQRRADIDLSTATAVNNCSDTANSTETGTTSTATSSTNVTFYSPNSSSSLQTSNELLHDQKLSESNLNNAVEVDEIKQDHYNDDIIAEKSKQNMLEMAVRGKSPLRRKPIRDLSEESSPGIRSSPRLRQRRSLDREKQKSSLTESSLETSPVSPVAFRARRPLIAFDTPQNKQNNTTIDTIQSELTPLNTDNQSRQEEIIQDNKSNSLIHSASQRRSELLEKHIINTNSHIVSKCTMLSIAGIDLLHEESLLTIGKEELLSNLETIDTVNLAKEDTISNIDVDTNDIEINERGNSLKIVNLKNTEEDDSKHFTIECSTNAEFVEFVEFVEFTDVREEDIGKGLDDQGQKDEEIIRINQSDFLESALDDEPMEVDENNDDERGSVIEINSSNASSVANSSSRASDEHDYGQNRATDNSTFTDSSNEYNNDDKSARYTLNRATFLKEDSRSTAASSYISQKSSHSQRNSYINEDSLNSADMEDDIEIDTSEGSSVSDIYLQETEVESNADSNSNNESVDVDAKDKQDDSDSLNLNINVEVLGDNSKETSDSGLAIKELSETTELTGTPKNIEEKKENIISRTSSLNESTNECQRELFKSSKKDASLSESIDVLQITLTDDNVDSITVEEDILCKSWLDTDLSRNTDTSKSFQTSTRISSGNIEVTTQVDPLLEESVIEEDILVDPDILSVTFNEADPQNHQKITKRKEIDDSDSKSTSSKAIDDNDCKLKEPTRRSARLRRDSTSSIATSNTHAGFDTPDKNSKKATASVCNPKVLRKTRRSLSVDEEPTQSKASRRVVSKPARRSSCRTRSVDESTFGQGDKQSQTMRWLTTIVEEQSQETATSNKLLSVGAVKVVEEMVRDAIWTVGGHGVGKRRCRSSSVDSSPVTIQSAGIPKRGRPRKTTESSPVSLNVNDGNTGSSSSMQTRTRARTSSISSTRSDSILSTAPRLGSQMEKIKERKY